MLLEWFRQDKHNRNCMSFDGFALSLDLYKGITLSVLKALEKVLFIMFTLKTYIRALVMNGAASRKLLALIPPKSWVPDRLMCLRAL